MQRMQAIEAPIKNNSSKSASSKPASSDELCSVRLRSVHIMHGYALVYIYIYILDWTCRYTSAGMFISSEVEQQKRGTAVTVTLQLQSHLGVT